MAGLPTINANTVIQRNIARFPHMADELVTAQQYYRQLKEDKLSKIKNTLADRAQLRTADVGVPKRLLEPGVTYRRDWLADKLNPHTRPDGLPGGGYVDFIDTRNVPMGDWDFPDKIHDPSSVSIENLGNVYDSLDRYTTDNPNSSWQVYLTPGGVRAFELGQQYTPRQFAGGGLYRKNNPNNRFVQLNIDENYGKIATNKGNLKRKNIPADELQALVDRNDLSALAPWNLNQFDPNDFGDDILNPTQSWAARVSGKPGRPEDFVAFPLSRVGTGIVNPYNQRIVDEYHDLPIMRSMLNDGMTPRRLPPTGMELLEYHLNTVPNNYKFGIEENLARMGIM